jgi:hypothetical protein
VVLSEQSLDAILVATKSRTDEEGDWDVPLAWDEAERVSVGEVDVDVDVEVDAEAFNFL